jgi:xanthine dehydrogenase iron-sulfur cluster and FAD-binding subunit A
MVISVACFAVILDTTNRRVRAGMGSVGPTPLRPTEAEQAVSDAIDWDQLTCPDEADRRASRTRAPGLAEPISDHRSTADYRRHASGSSPPVPSGGVWPMTDAS